MIGATRAAAGTTVVATTRPDAASAVIVDGAIAGIVATGPAGIEAIEAIAVLTAAGGIVLTIAAIGTTEATAGPVATMAVATATEIRSGYDFDHTLRLHRQAKCKYAH